MNMMNEKYRNKYKGASDWIGAFVGEQCTSQTDDNQTPHLDLEKLFTLAEQNGIETGSYRGQADNKNAPGRLRMTIGNMLRARAKRRHGLLDINGKEVTPPAEFELGEKTETLQGEKIKKDKPKASKDDTPAESTGE